MPEHARKELPRLYKEYGITGKKAKPEPKKKAWIQSVLERFKRKKKQKRMTLPHGVRTPEQIKELREIMGLD